MSNDFRTIAIYLGHLFLVLLSKIKVCFLIPKPIVKRFLASYILIFVKNYHVGLKNPTHPLRDGGVKIGQKWWGICKACYKKKCLEIDPG